MIGVTAQYFALFRELAGKESETIDTTAETAGQLFSELSQRYGFVDPMEMERCKVAINDELVDWDSPLTPGDAVLFFPPVAAG